MIAALAPKIFLIFINPMALAVVAVANKFGEVTQYEQANSLIVWFTQRHYSVANLRSQ